VAGKKTRIEKAKTAKARRIEEVSIVHEPHWSSRQRKI
jgi:hypothetical protein